MKNFKKFIKKWNKEGIRQSLERKRQRKSSGQQSNPLLFSRNNKISAGDLVDAKFENCRPLVTFVSPDRSIGRLNLITDSVNEGSLFGGVGTAIILAGLLCKEKRCDLRIITRRESAGAANVKRILDLYKIDIKNNIEFTHASIAGGYHPIDITAQDVFLTTSWWTTAAVLPSVPVESIYYLLQEDERMFYAYGDERLRCEEVLSNSQINFVINTKLLYDHFLMEGFENIRRSAKWFEPAFPEHIFYPRSKSPGKKRLFFYARPNNQRNLFFFGIELIDKAVRDGLISPLEWEVVLVGNNIPDLKFHGDIDVKRMENLSWHEYSELIGGVDLGLSLMCTPHPSYPPLDLAASGTPVVTNRFQNKVELGGYSDNIICANLNIVEMTAALKIGISLCQDKQNASVNYQKSGLSRAWQTSLSEVISFINI